MHAVSRLLQPCLAIGAACFLVAVAARAHDEGPPGFLCTEGPFGVPGLSLPPDQIGEWGPEQSLPVLGTHATLLHTGKVFFWKQSVRGHLLWDPETGTTEPKPLGTSSDLFCAGHATLADGRVVVIGGGGSNNHDAIADTYQFDPLTETWTQSTDMALPRWYPTATILADGRVLASGGVYDVEGSIVATAFHEAYDPSTNSWTTVLTPPIALGVYPPMFTLDDGRILYLASNTAHQLLDVENDSSEPAPTGLFGDKRNGCSAMVRPNEILKLGGDGVGTDGFSTNMAEVLDLNAATPAWRLVDPMAYPRRRPDLVLLPTGQALVVGGSVDGQNSPECAVHAAELWDPDTEAWTTMASMEASRVYHSTALLLPDGRVVAAGGENSHTGGDYSVEVYSPPYLFKGPRPEISAAPDAIDYGSVFQVDTSDSIASVALMRPGSTTHNFDQNQRFLRLAFQPQGAGIAVTAPATSRLAPPGFYMLFLVNSAGVPSVARFVQLSAECNDGIDNDGDGLVDSLNDPGCAKSWASSESPECDDGIDNDLDGDADLADIGCASSSGRTEAPQCSDGINNDPRQDGLIDFDGGLSVLGYAATDPDTSCLGQPWKDQERLHCGLGVELALTLSGLMWLHRRRQR